MAVTKILARKGRLDACIRYVLNGDKTAERVLVARSNCEEDMELQEMMKTKQQVGKTKGIQYYHIIQSFKPGEITPELALEIAKEFVAEHLPGYEAVIGVHTDRRHIHAHILFNSVNWVTGQKYHSNAQSYYRQIRAISDKLCRKHGLSVIINGETSQAMSYIEWLKRSKGQPTFRSMLEADLRSAVESANDLGHFYMLMEHMGYEIDHGKRLGFRLRGQERFMYPERKNRMFSEDGIKNAIDHTLEEIETGQRPAVPKRTPYKPYKKHPKYTGFMALYVHYLYILGKIEKRQYPPRMTPKMKAEVMKAEKYQAQFIFLRNNNITTKEEMAAFQKQTEETLAALTKQRTILNVRKKKRKKLYAALADAATLEPAKTAYENGVSGVEAEYARYVKAVQILKNVSRDSLLAEKAELYEQIAEINCQIRAEQQKLRLCQEITDGLPRMEEEIQNTERNEVKRNERRRR